VRYSDPCQRKVREFLQAVGLPVSEGVTTELDFELLKNLVDEEATEFVTGMDRLAYHVKKHDSMDDVLDAQVEVIDAICDIIVVLHNTTNAMGIDITPFFDEVHRSNMAKVGGSVREDGKRLKPEGWTPPDLMPILKKQCKER